jgi:hypothetical protein
MRAFISKLHMIEPMDYESRFTVERFVLRLGLGGDKGVKEVFVANIVFVRVVILSKVIAAAPGAQKGRSFHADQNV